MEFGNFLTSIPTFTKYYLIIMLTLAAITTYKLINPMNLILDYDKLLNF